MAESEDERLHKLRETYRVDQEDLAYIYRAVRLTFGIPFLDPEKGHYVINVGCGGKPDQDAINEAFRDPSESGPLPIVGIDLALQGFVFQAEEMVRPEDNVELILGDAAEIIPKVVKERGHPPVITARNVDALFRAEELPEKFLKDHPELNTSWHDVFREVYAALPEEGGFFIVTYKNSQELINIVAYMFDVGFIPCPIDISKPDRRSLFQKIADIREPGYFMPKVKSDQFVIVGVKNMSPELEARFKDENPDFSIAAFNTEREKAELRRRGFQRERLYKDVRRGFDDVSVDERMRLLITYFKELNIDISPEVIDCLQSLDTNSTKLVVNFADIERFDADDQDQEAEKGGIFKYGKPGRKTRLALDGNVDDRQMSVRVVTIYEYPKRGQIPTSSLFIPSGEVVLSHVVAIYCSPDELKPIQQLLDQSIAS